MIEQIKVLNFKKIPIPFLKKKVFNYFHCLMISIILLPNFSKETYFNYEFNQTCKMITNFNSISDP